MQVKPKCMGSAGVQRRCRVVVTAHSADVTRPSASALSRRDVLLTSLGAALAAGAPPAAWAVTDTKAVGAYLPPAGVDDFVTFIPDAKKTPALRAGTADPNSPYRFNLPPTWTEGKVPNISSGNYCQPRCDEPWTEVVFSAANEGKAELIVSPLVKLTNKKNVRVEDLGTPENVLDRIGNFITGTYLDEEDVQSITKKTQDDGLTYYYYEINASYGKVGPRTLTACTAKGDLVFLFIVSATDKQWAKSESTLRKVLQSFRA